MRSGIKEFPDIGEKNDSCLRSVKTVKSLTYAEAPVPSTGTLLRISMRYRHRVVENWNSQNGRFRDPSKEECGELEKDDD